MKRVGRALRTRLTYANVVATLALFFAMGGTAAAAVLISSNSQVAQNTISGHQPPTGKHANVIAGSINANDLAANTRTSLKVHCPAGMQQGVDICFEPTVRAAAAWTAAVGTCSYSGYRLPDVGELGQVFDHGAAPQGYEWTSIGYVDFGVSQNYAAEMGIAADRSINYGAAVMTLPKPFRCVATPTN